MRSILAPLLASVLVLTAIAGCLDGPTRSGSDVSGQPDEADRGPEAFWFVWLQGNETHDPPPRHMCSIVFDHEVRPGTRELVYSDRTYNLTDPPFVIAFDHFQQGSDCPLAYRLHLGFNETTVELGRYGEMTFTPRKDGSLVLQAGSMEQELVPGRSATFTYSDRYASSRGGYVDANGTLTVDHRGVWPASGLTPRGR